MNKSSKIFCTVLILVLGSSVIKAQSVIKQYPVKYDAVQSKTFKIYANDDEVFVEDYKDIHYTNFGMKGEVEIKIIVPEEIKSYSISPVRYDIESESLGNEIILKLKEPKKLVVYVNELERLFIFADGIKENIPLPNDKNVVSIEAYEVDSKGSKIETSKIQKAIDETAASEKILYFPAGVYLTGTLKLKTNSQIYLAPGAMILGSPDRKDYPQDEGFQEADQVKDPDNYTNKGWKMTYSRLILIGETENVKI